MRRRWDFALELHSKASLYQYLPRGKPLQTLTGEILKWALQFRGDTQRWERMSGSRSAGPEAVPGSPHLHVAPSTRAAGGSQRASARRCCAQWDGTHWNRCWIMVFGTIFFQSIVIGSFISFIGGCWLFKLWNGIFRFTWEGTTIVSYSLLSVLITYLFKCLYFIREPG